MNFSGYDCTIELTQYAHNGQKAMQLYDANDGEPIARATVCIDYDFQENQTAIKDWSENEGMLQALIDSHIVKDTGIRVPCGFTEAAIVEILNDGNPGSTFDETPTGRWENETIMDIPTFMKTRN